MGKSTILALPAQLLTKGLKTASLINGKLHPVKFLCTSAANINRQYYCYINQSDKKKLGVCVAHQHRHFLPQSIMGGLLSALHTSSRLPQTNNNENSYQFERKVIISQPSMTDPGKMLTFEMSVLDTFPDDVEQERSTVVALHGIPGSATDFLSLAKKLKMRGIRMVAPTCLGMESSPIDVDQMPEIDFTSKGRTKNLQLVLAAMNLHRVDMLFGHSAGAWAIYEASCQWSNVRSIVCTNPGGAQPNRRIRPFVITKFLAALLRQPFIRRILMPILPSFYRFLGFKVDSKSGATHLVVSQQYMTQQGYEYVPGNAAVIRQKQIPVVIAYALNDKFIEPAICAPMAHDLLGIPIANTVMYADDKTPNRDPLFVPKGTLTRCLVFSRGGHIVHIAHEAEIVDQITDILKHVAAGKASIKTSQNTVQSTESAGN